MFGSLLVPSVTFLVPFLGAIVALGSPGIGAAVAERAWGASRRRGAIAGALVLIVLWFPVVSIFVQVPLLSSDWSLQRFFPLCGPSDAIGWLVPGVVAIVAFAGGVALSLRFANPWLWAAGAVAASAAFHVSWLVLVEAGQKLVC